MRIIHNSGSVGMEAASNIRLQHSNSRYVKIHDDDDTWEPDFLQKCVAYLEDPPRHLETPVKDVICYSKKILEDFDGKTITFLKAVPFNTWINGVSLFRLAASNCFPPISFLFAREALATIGSFREDLPVLGDLEFHLRFAYQFEIDLIREELAKYHHRTSLKDSIYGNTVIAGEIDHQRYNFILRNELLRQDLREGRPGLGFLVKL